MKSSSSKALPSVSTKKQPAPAEGSEKRALRTFAQAASELGRVVGSTLGGGTLTKSRRDSAASSAAASVHRLRDVLERDRAITAVLGMADGQMPVVPLLDRNEHVITHAAPAASARSKVCEQCGAGEHPVTTEHSTASAQREQREAKPRAARLRVPPPPPRAPVLEYVLEEPDEDEVLSVHDEPTKVGPPPKHAEPLDERPSALAAAAASAFGSASPRR
jgi:hypothetical protein